MNNSKFAIEHLFDEPKVDHKPELRENEVRLVKTIEALRAIAKTKEWSTLKNTVFDGVVETLENRLKSEASKKAPDTMELARINGQLVWARKYADLDSLAELFRLELTHVRTQLYGKTQEES